MNIDPSLVMVLLWLGYLLTHMGPAVSGVREVAIRRWGKVRFVVAFGVAAQAGMAVLAWYYATHRFQGAPGPALGRVPGMVPALSVCIVLGLVLLLGAAAPTQYVSSALNTHLPTVRQPYGLERITRHPFFAGAVLWSVPHALLSTRLVGSVFFAGFAALGVFGALHQERKVTADRGDDFRRYLESTSFVPFAAILAGRQRLAVGELPWAFLLGCVAAVGLLRVFHAGLMGWNGLGFALVLAVTTSLFLVVSVWKGRRASA